MTGSFTSDYGSCCTRMAGVGACAWGLLRSTEAGCIDDSRGEEDMSRLIEIDQRIAGLGDWRGDTLARVRELIHEAIPDVVEELKWRGTPVWSHGGIICTGETYKDKVKLTFAKGASLKDPTKLFNASLDGNVRRAIDIGKGEAIDAKAFKALVRAAADLNAAPRKASVKRAK